jgi:DNA mismatch endonuclease (patch repair protein)
MMSGIKGKDFRPEMQVRRMLFAAGLRFRLHRRDLPGTPDIVLPSRRIVIFVQGYFWHAHQGCKYAKLQSTRQDFWEAKLLANVERDRRALNTLNSLGWRVLWVWECATRSAQDLERLQERILDWIDGGSVFGEILGRAAVSGQPT